MKFIKRGRNENDDDDDDKIKNSFNNKNFIKISENVFTNLHTFLYRRLKF